MAKNNNKVKEEIQGNISMYRVLLSKNKADHPQMIFGKPFTYDEYGNAVVSIPASSLKNELKRKSPLLTEKGYAAFLEAEEAIAEAAEEEE